MEEKIREKIVETVKEVMNIDITKLESSRKINTISEWDSFNNLMLISKFQEDFGIEFSVVEIENTQTIADLFEIIEKKAKKS